MGAPLDLIGQRFGLLRVVGLSDKRQCGNRVWICECECGNTVEAKTSWLRGGGVVSCGCNRRKKSKKNLSGSREEKLGIVDGTNLSRIQSTKLPRNNTSGTQGVYWNKGIQKWIAYIGFKGRRINLGAYKNIEDAIAARKLAEKEIYRPEIEKYKKK